MFSSSICVNARCTLRVRPWSVTLNTDESSLVTPSNQPEKSTETEQIEIPHSGRFQRHGRDLCERVMSRLCV